MAIFESGEMYLETILLLAKEKDRVRAIDIGEYMGFSKPSVSRALGNLKDEGYVLVDDNNGVKLTEKGTELADKIYERHQVITGVLTAIGVSEKIAEQDACKIEHVISDETFLAIKKHQSK